MDGRRRQPLAESATADRSCFEIDSNASDFGAPGYLDCDVDAPEISVGSVLAGSNVGYRINEKDDRSRGT